VTDATDRPTDDTDMTPTYVKVVLVEAVVVILLWLLGRAFS
jgi:hypothetical protein